MAATATQTKTIGTSHCNYDPIETEDESDSEKNLEFRQESDVNFVSRNSQRHEKYRNTRSGNNLAPGKDKKRTNKQERRNQVTTTQQKIQSQRSR